jgi:hypothetical protein
MSTTVTRQGNTFAVICRSSSSSSMLMREEEDTARGRFGGISLSNGDFDGCGCGVAVVLCVVYNFPHKLGNGMVTKPLKRGRLVNLGFSCPLNLPILDQFSLITQLI